MPKNKFEKPDPIFKTDKHEIIVCFKNKIFYLEFYVIMNTRRKEFDISF